MYRKRRIFALHFVCVQTGKVVLYESKKRCTCKRIRIRVHCQQQKISVILAILFVEKSQIRSYIQTYYVIKHKNNDFRECTCGRRKFVATFLFVDASHQTEYLMLTSYLFRKVRDIHVFKTNEIICCYCNGQKQKISLVLLQGKVNARQERGIQISKKHKM